jgi:autotransporter-associated beta strand protein
VTLTSAKTGTASTIYSGNITSSGALTVGGSTLTNTRTTLKGVNTFTGDTRINSGNLYIGANSGADSQALAKSTVDLNASDSGTLNFGTVNNGGTIVSITSATFGGLKGSRDLALTNISASPAAVALTLGNNNTDASYSGNLTGSGSLIKVGTGAQTLSGTNTYTGVTTVNLGTLLVNGSLTSAMTANAGTIGGAGSTTGNVTIGNSAGGSDAFIAPGNGTVGTFTAGGSLSMLSDATYSFELNGSSAAADQLVANGVTINSSAVFSFTLLGDKSGLATQTFKIIDNTSVSNISGVFSNLTAGGIYDAGGGLTFSVSGGGGSYGNDLYLTVATVPEPATWGLLAFSLTTVLVLRRRRS